MQRLNSSATQMKTARPMRSRSWPCSSSLECIPSGQPASSFEGTIRIEVRSTRELPFDKVANDPRIAFTKSDGVWCMSTRDPRLELREED
jgi:hypothetical protein